MDLHAKQPTGAPSQNPQIQTDAASAASFRRYARKLDPLLSKPQNRVYTATILSFLVISLFLWYAIRPTMQTIFTLRREIRDNQIVSKDMEDKISALVQAQATYQSVSAKIPLLEEALPGESKPVDVMISLRNLASIANASVSGITIPSADLLNPTASRSSEAKPVISGVQPVEFTMSIDGTYASIKQFLDGILQMRRILRILEVSIEPLQVKEFAFFQEPNLRLIIRLQASYIPE